MEPLLITGFKCEVLKDVLYRLGYQPFYMQLYDGTQVPADCALCIVDLRGISQMSEVNYLIRQLDPRIHIVVIVDKTQLALDNITTFIAQFAWDYCTSPIEPERLAKCLGHGSGLAKLKFKSQATASNNTQIGPDSAASEAMQVMFRQIERVAPTDIPVLIRGESGTGKELVAKKLHRLSSRKKGPLVTLNCGAMAPGLVQSELFGHEKGAFTGASQARQGKIALSDGGTLFLDEIGDLPAEIQVNLLRFLQEGFYDSVGGTTPKTADVRIVAATHVDLESAIDEGSFRLDLFYRLNGITIETPPLKERRDDILSLTEEFIQTYSEDYGLPVKHLTQAAKQALLNHSWPGNVRELINRVRRAVVLSENNQLSAENLELMAPASDTCLQSSLKSLKDEAEKQAIQAALSVANGQADVAANQLQVSRATLYRLIEKHGLQLV